MKEYKIDYQGWHSQKEITGEDLVYFECIAYINANSNSYFPITLPYDIIEQQVRITIPEGVSIVQKIRKGVRGWGIKESAYVQEMEECGINLEEIFEKAIESNIDLQQEEIRFNSYEFNTDL